MSNKRQAPGDDSDDSRGPHNTAGETMASIPLVTPCRGDRGHWCTACVELHVPAEDGPLTAVALEADPSCGVCRVQGRCVCVAVPAGAVRHG